MNAEGRNHHHRNYSEVQKHDGGLAPGVLPKTLLASKPSAKQKTYPHGDFEDENYIGGARSGRFKKCFYQQIIPTQTTDCVWFVFSYECRVAGWTEFILAIGRKC